MHAIILADRTGHELWPLTIERPACLLTVGNKPLLQITVEELFDLGIREATIVSGRGAERVEDIFRTGRRWGMRFTHHAVTASVTPQQALELTGLAPNGEWLMVRGDILRPFGFLEEAIRRRSIQRSGDIFMAMGIAMPAEEASAITDITWEAVQATCRLHPCAIDTPATYLSANLMALRGLVPGIRLHGRPAPDRVTIGRGAVVRSRRVPEASVAIGDFCIVEKDTTIGPNVTIGSNSIIGEGTELEDCVVLPNTYVGKGLTIRHAIIDGPRLISVARGMAVTSPLPSILSELAPAV